MKYRSILLLQRTAYWRGLFILMTATSMLNSCQQKGQANETGSSTTNEDKEVNASVGTDAERTGNTKGYIGFAMFSCYSISGNKSLPGCPSM